jgi:hypothetical protein
MEQYARLPRNSVDGHRGAEVALRSVRRAPAPARAAGAVGERPLWAVQLSNGQRAACSSSSSSSSVQQACLPPVRSGQVKAGRGPPPAEGEGGGLPTCEPGNGSRAAGQHRLIGPALAPPISAASAPVYWPCPCRVVFLHTPEPDGGSVPWPGG